MKQLVWIFLFTASMSLAQEISITEAKTTARARELESPGWKGIKFKFETFIRFVLPEIH